MAITKPFQLLEITIISAQDLEPKTKKKMRTYATAWINPARKLTTIVDTEGGSNPTWNDKFVFRVDEEFLRRDNSAVEFEIYKVRWFRDSLIGTVRLLVGNLIPPPAHPHHHHHQHFGMRFAAVQVRRPSGRPQGILNIGVAVLDSSMRSMPLYQKAVSAVGYRHLMEEDHLPRNNNDGDDDDGDKAPSPKPILHRSRSDRSEFLALDNASLNSSMVAIPRKKDKVIDDDKESSILSISLYPPPPPPPLMKETNAKKGKASSVINGADLKDDAKYKSYKTSSVVSDSIMIKDSPRKIANKSEAQEKNEINGPKVDESPTKKVVDGKPKAGVVVGGKPNTPKINGMNKLVIGGGPYKANSIPTDSEVGPSPSEVAAAMAERPRYPLEDSVLDGWSLDESVEGLRSKLERWRTELPPLYDHGGYASSSFRSTSQYTAAAGKRGKKSGLFSCFGNLFGYECQCVCGKPPQKSHAAAKARLQTPSPFR